MLGHAGKTVALGDGDAAVLGKNPLRHLRQGFPGEIQVHVIEVADRAELAAFNIVVLIQDAIKPLWKHGTLPESAIRNQSIGPISALCLSRRYRTDKKL